MRCFNSGTPVADLTKPEGEDVQSP